MQNTIKSLPTRLRLAAVVALAAVAASTFATGAAAQAAGGAKAPAPIERELRDVLPKRGLPAVEAVLTTPVSGLYEVQAGKQLYYVDAGGNYAFTGGMIDLKTKVNLSKAKIEKLTTIEFDKLPLQDAIKVVKGNGSRKMAVFADPNCSFCKRLEKELEGITNVTIYTFLFPILGPDSIEKSRDVWCAKDRSKTWEDWMLRSIKPASMATAGSSCDTGAINRSVEFGRTYGVSGTPAIFFEDGTRNSGLAPADRLNARLDAAANAVKAKK